MKENESLAELQRDGAESREARAEVQSIPDSSVQGWVGTGAPLACSASGSPLPDETSRRFSEAEEEEEQQR